MWLGSSAGRSRAVSAPGWVHCTSPAQLSPSVWCKCSPTPVGKQGGCPSRVVSLTFCSDPFCCADDLVKAGERGQRCYSSQVGTGTSAALAEQEGRAKDVGRAGRVQRGCGCMVCWQPACRALLSSASSCLTPCSFLLWSVKCEARGTLGCGILVRAILCAWLMDIAQDVGCPTGARPAFCRHCIFACRSSRVPTCALLAGAVHPELWPLTANSAAARLNL